MGVNALALSSDGGLLATGGEDHTLRNWKFTTDPPGVISGFSGWVSSAAFSANDRQVALGSGDGTVAVQDLASGTRRLTLKPEKGWISGVAFSPDATLLAASTEYGGVQVWDAGTGRHVRSLTDPGAFMRAVAFSPDGGLIAACSGNHEYREAVPGVVCLWDSSTGALRYQFKRHTSRVFTLAFSSDGRWIASGGSPDHKLTPPSAEILVWEASTGQIVHRLLGHTGVIRKLQFSRDGRWIMSGSDDLTVRIWSAESGSLAPDHCDPIGWAAEHGRQSRGHANRRGKLSSGHRAFRHDDGRPDLDAQGPYSRRGQPGIQL